MDREERGSAEGGGDGSNEMAAVECHGEMSSIVGIIRNNKRIGSCYFAALSGDNFAP